MFAEAERGDIRFWHLPHWTERGIIHGFLGADLDLLQRESLSRFQTVFAPDNSQLYLLRQVHGVEIVSPMAGSARDQMPASRPEGDGWFSRPLSGHNQDMPRAILGILTADCFPVLIHCIKSHASAALHCGWRGAVGGLVQKTLKLFLADGSTPDSLEFAVGPGASAKSYEVGSDLALLFAAAGAELAASLKTSVSIVQTHCGRSFCNIAGLLELQARAAGLESGRIYLHPGCTITDSELFSFRRQKDLAGRQLSFVAQHIIQKEP